jgi:glycosyltransferase involved in cell wall biosynthesis
MTGKLRCSIVVRAYNEEAHIGRLLEGLMQQSVRDVEIILVDSGSTDATVALARRYPVRVVSISPESFTFGYSLNQGIAAAAGEFIVIASAHVYPVYPDWLERMLAPFADPQVALTYGKQRGMATTHYSEHQVFARWFPDGSNSRQAHPFCNNANAAIRRSLWEEHPYDETLTGLEDLAWAKWAVEQGYLLSYVAEAEIIHVHDETPRQVFNRYRREAMAFKRIFPDESFFFWDFLRLVHTNTFSDLWHAVREGALLNNWRSIFWFRFFQFWGTYQGYRQANQPLTAPLRQTFYYPRGLRSAETAGGREVEPIRYNETP